MTYSFSWFDFVIYKNTQIQYSHGARELFPVARKPILCRIGSFSMVVHKSARNVEKRNKD